MRDCDGSKNKDKGQHLPSLNARKNQLVGLDPRKRQKTAEDDDDHEDD
jgi:hypothetical protein